MGDVKNRGRLGGWLVPVASGLVVVFFMQLLFFGSKTAIKPAELEFPKLERFFDSLEQHNKFMGTLLLSKGNSGEYRRSMGYSSIKGEVPINEQTRFAIGSISKTFTAVMVFKAVEEGLLSLDETLLTFKRADERADERAGEQNTEQNTERPNPYGAITNVDKITVEMLLSHRSGIGNFTEMSDYLSWNSKYQSREAMIERIVECGSLFEPDTQSQYSNSNYLLLSYLLEDLYGKSYSDLLYEMIVVPLDLSLTNLPMGLDLPPELTKVVNSYIYADGWVRVDDTNTSVAMGAGSIISSARDLHTFINALFNGELVGEESLEKMSYFREALGMGLIWTPFYERSGVGHNGRIDGFTSMMLYFEPDEPVTVVLLSNGLAWDMNEILIAVLSEVYGKEYEVPTFTLSGYEHSEEELNSFIGVYHSDILGMDITITVEDGKVMAQATGQQKFPLEAKDAKLFVFDAAGIAITFLEKETAKADATESKTAEADATESKIKVSDAKHPKAPGFTLKQHGQNFQFERVR